MRSIIRGKVYDTEKATLVCKIWEGAKGDFRHFEAELYQTPRSKQYFLAGSGGQMTCFARRVDQNSWSGGSGIIPLSEEDALRYAEQYASSDVVELFFKVEEA